MAVPLRRDAGDGLRLREFLEELGPDELQRVSGPVELADVAATLDGNPKAVWFERLSLAGNVTGSRSRLALASAPHRAICCTRCSAG